MRLFIGVWLSEATREEVMDYIRLVQKDSMGLKWTSPENLHFTLKFLGDTPENRLDELVRALRTAATQNQVFGLTLGKVGFFPPKGVPRVVWLDVSEGRDELVKLAGLVEESCLQSVFPKADKPFEPHLTIARAKNDLPKIKMPESNKDFRSETMVSGFSLIESKLFSGGPVYQTIKIFPFGRA